MAYEGLGRFATMPILDLACDLPPMTRPKLWAIQTTVARKFGLTMPELRDQNRKRRVAWPRQVVEYLARDLTDMSYPQIARIMGNRDHTTTLFSYRKVARLASVHEEARTLLDDLRVEINGGERPSGQSTAWYPPATVHKPRKTNRKSPPPSPRTLRDIKAWGLLSEATA